GGSGQSPRDRSLSIKIDPAAPEGFLVHSFAGDDPIVCRDHVRGVLGLSLRPERSIKQPPRREAHHGYACDDIAWRIASSLRIWDEARDPRGTVVADYLASRGLALPDDIATDVIRFHPALKFRGELVRAMVALFRDIGTNEPCGIHRTFLDCNRQKLGRKMLGRAKGAAIKLDANENVTLGLH